MDEKKPKPRRMRLDLLNDFPEQPTLPLLPKRDRSKLDPNRHAAYADVIEAIQRDHPGITLEEINAFLDSV